MSVWQIPALIVALLLLGSPLLAYLGAGPAVFNLFGLGVVLGMVCTIVLAASAAFASATGRAWRSSAVRATVVPMVLTLGVLGIGLSRGNHPIHDVTTDPGDTLAFTPDVAALEQMPMTREMVLAKQRETYPDLAPLELSMPSDAAFARALAAGLIKQVEGVSENSVFQKLDMILTAK